MRSRRDCRQRPFAWLGQAGRQRQRQRLTGLEIDVCPCATPIWQGYLNGVAAGIDRARPALPIEEHRSTLRSAESQLRTPLPKRREQAAPEADERDEQ